ncbi:ABC transporter ATP-binding protein [Amphritea balenae]|uniref:ATP-binding cassette domain-containing protein n=1 Tax=Amphritea balenae TaxID=452629 RepID=A0A3P1STH9_9GAMM|nr:ABC transporter ATP-binding protein [Amphritea balenae]RRD00509.1 ATP-binding cassette domain-containing protein [Amphritea balenae]GGK70149.1 ABC transporter ATP-binding protein [Amphritea balenae]
MSIKIDNISFSYGPRKALCNLNLELKSGQFNALLGPNGAGKSTLFALLTRLYALQSGEVFIAGHSIHSHPAQVMRQLGVVFQQSTLDLDLSVEQNLLYHAALHGISAREARPRVTRELERFELTDRLKDKVRTLNGGHRRRVEIARALLHQPSILLLDEPSVGLDPATRQQLNHHIRQLCNQQKLTVLWATHLIEEVQEDDPVIILHQGNVLASGQVSSLVNASDSDNLNDLFQQLTGAEQ